MIGFYSVYDTPNGMKRLMQIFKIRAKQATVGQRLSKTVINGKYMSFSALVIKELVWEQNKHRLEF